MRGLRKSNLYAYTSLSGALRSLARAGPSELFLGFLPSALRDAPYAGLFVMFYESIKNQTCASALLFTLIPTRVY